MRVARLKESGKRACYHVMSRVVDRQMVLGLEEKERFRKLLRAVESFSGVNVLTYAILDNHFHSDGVVLGSKSFVEDVFQRNRQQFGLKRKTGARPLCRAEVGDLCTMRDLRREVISPPKAA
jgi:hypothetical protein